MLTRKLFRTLCRACIKPAGTLAERQAWGNGGVRLGILENGYFPQSGGRASTLVGRRATGILAESSCLSSLRKAGKGYVLDGSLGCWGSSQGATEVGTEFYEARGCWVVVIGFVARGTFSVTFIVDKRSTIRKPLSARKSNPSLRPFAKCALASLQSRPRCSRRSRTWSHKKPVRRHPSRCDSGDGFALSRETRPHKESRTGFLKEAPYHSLPQTRSATHPCITRASSSSSRWVSMHGKR